MNPKREIKRAPTAASTTAILKRSEEASASEWDAFYRAGRSQWRSTGIGTIARGFLRGVPQGSDFLEVGCGLGDDAKDIIEFGFKYDGIDLSPAAITQAEERLKGTNARLFVADIFSWTPKKAYAVVYEKGVLHGLDGPRRWRSFANRVACALIDDGIWITVTGAADNFDQQHPRGALLLTNLARAVEPYFEILQVLKGPYGVRDTGFDFDAWYGLFRRRSWDAHEYHRIRESPRDRAAKKKRASHLR